MVEYEAEVEIRRTYRVNVVAGDRAPVRCLMESAEAIVAGPGFDQKPESERVVVTCITIRSPGEAP